jgi:hypothetical protein
MMKSRWKEYKGQRYFLADYSGFGTNFESLKLEVDAADAILVKEPPDSVRVLLDFRGTVGSTEVVNYFKDSAARTRKYVKKNAVLGISGVRKVLLESVSRITGQVALAFNDEDKAIEWLFNA